MGQTIAERYRVDHVLGMGGMGAVYRCHHLGLKRDVAVKLLHAEFMEDPNVSPRFDREAQSASRLEHPNCIRVMDYGTWTPVRDDGSKESPVKYMVLELLTGGDMSDLLGEALAPERVVELAVQMMRGLEHAHKSGVIHRDLKPENIFVTRDHEDRELLKLVDFGLAKVVSGEGSETRLTRTGMVFGTPHYMSPEQATGMPSDERTDIYAMGIIIWELLSGRPPFDGDDPISVIRQQVSTPLPPPPEGTPPELTQLMLEMTIKEPEKRTLTAGEARRRLEAMLPSAVAAGSAHSMAAPIPHAPNQPTHRPVGAAPHAAASAQVTVMDQGSFGLNPSMPPMMMSAGATQSHRRVARRPGKFTQFADDVGQKVGVSRLAVFGGMAVGVLIVLTGIGALLSGDDSGSGADTDGVAAPGFSVGLFSGVSEDELQKLDALISDNKDAEAQAKLDELLRDHPDEAALHLRRGLLFSRQEGRVGDAIESFDRGFELDPKAISNDELVETALRLVRHPDAGAAGLELALTRMGNRSHPLLLELVNRREEVLSYKDRHRIIATLEDDDEASSAVDAVLNRTLDLWQASESGDPCQTYEDALDEIEDEPNPYYVGSLLRSRPPAGTKEGSEAASKSGKGTVVSCPELETRRKELADEMSLRYPDAAKARDVPEDFKRVRSKKKKKFRLFGG